MVSVRELAYLKKECLNLVEVEQSGEDYLLGKQIETSGRTPFAYRVVRLREGVTLKVCEEKLKELADSIRNLRCRVAVKGKAWNKVLAEDLTAFVCFSQIACRISPCRQRTEEGLKTIFARIFSGITRDQDDGIISFYQKYPADFKIEIPRVISPDVCFNPLEFLGHQLACGLVYCQGLIETPALIRLTTADYVHDQHPCAMITLTRNLFGILKDENLKFHKQLEKELAPRRCGGTCCAVSSLVVVGAVAASLAWNAFSSAGLWSVE